MKNKVEITCMDINEGRMNKLKNNLSLLNILNIQYLCNDALIYNTKINYDRIIIDMPCSSSGTIRKNPDIKWRLNESIIKEFQTTQYKILNNMKNSLKIGGEIVYCTCSIFNDENEYNIIKFLKDNDNFSISNIEKLAPLKFINKIGGITILPNKNDYEGIFAIKLTRDA
jgi:16S rRNA (cytosine967-C5)-methyltransferase